MLEKVKPFGDGVGEEETLKWKAKGQNVIFMVFQRSCADSGAFSTVIYREGVTLGC